MTLPLTLDTLGALIDNRTGLWLHCGAGPRDDGTSCHFSRPIDLSKLTAHLGRDHSSMADDLLPHLFCPKCRSRRVSITLSPSTKG
jgi:hypothetical protein